MVRKFINPILAILFISCSVKEEIDEYSSIVWESPNGGFINYRYRSPKKLEKDKKLKEQLLSVLGLDVAYKVFILDVLVGETSNSM